MTTAGQAGRDRRDREADPDQEELVEVVAADQPEDDDERQRGAGHDRDQHGQLVELARERRLLLLDAAQHPGDLADLGRHAGRGDDHLAAAARHGRVHVGHVEAVAERDVVARHRVDRLQHRRALAGQRRLLDLERRGDEQAPVGRDLVAGLEGDDVARARAPRRGCRPAAPPRRTCALIRSIFWSAATLSAALPSWFRPRTALSTVRPMITMPVRELLQRDDADDRRAEQDELHQVAVLAQERPPARLLLRLGELVRAVLARAAARPRRRRGRRAARRRAARTPRRPSGRARPRRAPRRGRVVTAAVVVLIARRVRTMTTFVPCEPISSPRWCSGPRAYAIRPISEPSTSRIARRASERVTHHDPPLAGADRVMTEPPRRRARRRRARPAAASSGQTQRR